ncbi:MAG: TIGR04372 family glycosyltransferase, partial [Myxococcaceae bacterium]
VYVFLWFPVSIPFVLFMRLMRPILLIRLLNFQANSMGGFVIHADLYFRQKKLGMNIPKQRVYDIFYVGPKVANSQLLLMWRRVFPRIWDGLFYRFLYSVEWLNNGIPGSKSHVPFDNINTAGNLLKIVPPYLLFTEEEELRGQAEMRSMGIPEGALIVGLLVRDRAYMTSFQPEVDDSMSRDRNCDIEDFILACQELVRLGYYVVRMGAKVERSLETGNEKIIDYAKSPYRSEFMDMYLAKSCSFFISTGTGFDRVPTFLFNKPLLNVSFICLEDVIYEYRTLVVFLAKKCFDPLAHRNLSVGELFARNLSYLNNKCNLEMDFHKLRFIANSQEEILDAITETVELLNGTWTSHSEDEELQKRFLSFFPMRGRELPLRFSTHFLRKNKEWFLK